MLEYIILQTIRKMVNGLCKEAVNRKHAEIACKIRRILEEEGVNEN